MLEFYRVFYLIEYSYGRQSAINWFSHEPQNQNHNHRICRKVGEGVLLECINHPDVESILVVIGLDVREMSQEVITGGKDGRDTFALKVEAVK